MRAYTFCVQSGKLLYEQDCIKYSGSICAPCVYTTALLSASTLHQTGIKIIPITAEAMTSAYAATVGHRGTLSAVIHRDGTPDIPFLAVHAIRHNCE